jgi:hypothetical protein
MDTYYAYRDFKIFAENRIEFAREQRSETLLLGIGNDPFLLRFVSQLHAAMALV